jgi:hypothetical protein
VSGTSIPVSNARSVDLPEPEGPTTTESRAGRKVTSMPSSATCSPYRRDTPRALQDLAPRAFEPRRSLDRAADPAVDRVELDRAVAEDDPGAVVDAGGTKNVLGDAEPPAGTDDRGLRPAGALLAHATVPDVHDAIRDLGGSGIVADHDRGRAMLRDELGQELEHVARRFGVEVPGRFVGDQKSRAAGECGRKERSSAARRPRAPTAGAPALSSRPTRSSSSRLRFRRSPSGTDASPSGTATSSSAVSSPARRAQ